MSYLFVLVMQPFIYVENVGSENVLVRAAQQVIESIGKAAGGNYRVTRDVLPIIQVQFSFTLLNVPTKAYVVYRNVFAVTLTETSCI